MHITDPIDVEALALSPPIEHSSMDVESDEFCWICLDDSGKQGLMRPCNCPRRVHPKCLARWQLQQAGRPEETHCRFCNSMLADWKASLTPETLKPEVEKVQPIMVVYFEGEIHRIPVKQGNEGLSEFTNRIRELFRLPEDVDISLTFGCKEPMSGQHLKLEGIGAFDAAVHCASVAAAERQHKIKSTGGGSNPSAGGNNAASSSRGASTSIGGLQDLSGAGPSDLEHASTAPLATDDVSPSGATTVPMHTEPASDADAPSPFMNGPPMWPYTPSGSEALTPQMEEQLMLQHLAQQQLQLPVPLMHQQHQLMQLQQQMPCMPQDSYTDSIPQQDSLAPGTPGPHDHPFINPSFMSGIHTQPSSVPSMVMPSVISGLGSAMYRDLPLTDSAEQFEEETAVHPQRQGFSSDESSPRNTVNIRANSRRACRSPSRVSHVPGPDSLCGDEAIEGEHSLSGRFKTGVRTLAKKLASSLGRMVRHPDDHVFTFPDGQSSSSFVSGPLAPAAPQSQF